MSLRVSGMLKCYHGQAWRGCRVAMLAVMFGWALTGCKTQEVQFTRIAHLGFADAEPLAIETTLFARLPFDSTGFLQTLEALLDGGIRSREVVENLACDKRRTQWVECVSGTVTAELMLAGRPSLTVDGGRLVVAIPLKYDLTGRGYGWASYLTDRKSGTITAKIPIEVALGPGFRTALRLGRDIAWSGEAVPVLKAQVTMASIADAKLKALLTPALDVLKHQIEDPRVRQLGSEAWQSLAQPIAVMPEQWLRAEPKRFQSLSFAVNPDGDASLHLGLVARTTLHEGARPESIVPGPMPDPGREPSRFATTGGGSDRGVETTLRVPLQVSAQSFEAAVRTLFPKGERIETQADHRASPITVRVLDANLRPARDRFALELQLDVLEPQRLRGMTGKAYLVAKPVIDAEAGTIAFEDIVFPPALRAPGARDPAVSDLSARELGARELGARELAPQTKAQILRIGEEPFAGRFAASGRILIGDALARLLPQVNQTLAQAREAGTDMGGQFTRVEIASVMPAREGIRILVDLKGMLVIEPQRGGIVVTRPALQPTGAQAPPPQPPNMPRQVPSAQR